MDNGTLNRDCHYNLYICKGKTISMAQVQQPINQTYTPSV
jgi:hypothetical protein